MTAVVGWVRTFSSGQQELLIASDSRTSGGMRFDASPKIFPFSRGDCAIAFAGETGFAYPMMIQLASIIDSYRPARTRSLDIEKLRNELIRAFNEMLKNDLHSLAYEEQKNPELSFVFGGYSYVRKKFELNIAFRNAAKSRFEWKSAKSMKGKKGIIAFIGDGSKKLKDLTTQKIRISKSNYLNWEPLKALIEICRNASPDDTVGGPVQLIKLHQHMSYSMVPLYWPDKASGRIALHGRTLLKQEKCDGPILDPDTFKLEQI